MLSNKLENASLQRDVNPITQRKLCIMVKHHCRLFLKINICYYGQQSDGLATLRYTACKLNIPLTVDHQGNISFTTADTFDKQ